MNIQTVQPLSLLEERVFADLTMKWELVQGEWGGPVPKLRLYIRGKVEACKSKKLVQMLYTCMEKPGHVVSYAELCAVLGLGYLNKSSLHSISEYRYRAGEMFTDLRANVAIATVTGVGLCLCHYKRSQPSGTT